MKEEVICLNFNSTLTLLNGFSSFFLFLEIMGRREKEIRPKVEPFPMKVKQKKRKKTIT